MSSLSLSKKRVTNNNFEYPIWLGELWTAKQRQMHRIHYAISYRASFKPELPHYFISKYLKPKNRISKNDPLRDKIGQVVLDPFGGRGTTIIQANLQGYRGIHNDLSPVSIFLAKARRQISSFETLEKKVLSLDLSKKIVLNPIEKKQLLPFFHPKTLNEIANLKNIFLSKKKSDPDLDYIVLTALSRLHGHSDGFLSVYSFPQISILPIAQIKNNLKLGQKPEYRPIQERIIRKMKQDLSHPLPEFYHQVSKKNLYIQNDARNLKEVHSGSVDLIVTSPPFLDKVDYQTDNWMRAWFLNISSELKEAPLMVTPLLDEWCTFMREVMVEMGRVLKVGSRAVIEVGEVAVGPKNTNLFLEERMLECLPLLVDGGVLKAEGVYINKQEFTKLSHCWSVSNNFRGTNTNRCLVVVKEATS